MKAIILAAGKGERLGNITKAIPKPMICVGKKPILQHNIELCKKYGITEIYINIYHLGESIIEYFGDGSRFGVKIYYSIEERLLGTSGGVKHISETYVTSFKCDNKTSFEKQVQSDAFFVIYGDNLSDYNLLKIRDFGIKKKSLVTIAFHYREDVLNSGVSDFDNNGKILTFIEKPKEGQTSSHWVNAGIYYFHPKILDYIPMGYSDFSENIFPFLLEQNIEMFGICENVSLKAFDTIEMYTRNKLIR